MTDMTDERLLEMARDAAENAYAPYSNFRVGAALLCKSGKIYTGCNVENNSFGLTICAERAAIFKAVSMGEKDFEVMAVSTDTGRSVTPCGACMQVMAEFNPDIHIVISGENEGARRICLKKMFPCPFETLKDLKRISSG